MAVFKEDTLLLHPDAAAFLCKPTLEERVQEVFRSTPRFGHVRRDIVFEIGLEKKEK